MKKLGLVLISALLVGCMTACTTQTTANKEPESASVTEAATKILKGKHYQVEYYSDAFEAFDTGDGQKTLSYQLEAAGSNVIIFTDSTYKTPQEALNAKEGKLTDIEEIQFGDNKGYSRRIVSEGPSASGLEVYTQYCALEHNGNVVEVEMISTFDSREDIAIKISGMIENTIHSFKFVD